MFVVQSGALRGRLVCSPSDLVVASQCEFGFLSRLDEVLGRAERLVVTKDEMLVRASQLGDVHEAEELERFVAEFGNYVPGQAGGAAQIQRPDALTAEGIGARTQQTLTALNDGAEVVFQPVFFEEDATAEFGMYGMADFLERFSLSDDGTGDSFGYEVIDTKLARSPKPQALLQIAWYAEQVERLGFDAGQELHLLLGTKVRSSHPAREVRAVLRERIERLNLLVQGHRSAGETVTWGDARWSVCGVCDYCVQAIKAHDDLLQVAGLTRLQRDVLHSGGIDTMIRLAASTETVAGMSQQTWLKLRLQAQLQTGTADGVTNVGDSSYLVVEPEHIHRLPAPSPGDIFFDFEGDPLWRDAAGREWNLDYLFGWVTDGVDGGKPDFHALWADDLQAEKEAFIAFVAYIRDRMSQYPGMHIYHYAAYERTHLLSLALRHQVCEQEVDDLMRAGVLVDLYPVVRQSLRISAPSYSIKKVEPLYMGAELRDADVTDAGASVVAYAMYAELKEVAPDEAEALKDAILHYNHDDCLSTLRLRDWLLTLVPEGTDFPEHTIDGFEPEPDDPLEIALRDAVPGPEEPHRTPEEQAIALVGSSVGYHRREEKPFWWEHFARLADPVDEWPSPRNYLILDDVQIVSGWVKEDGKKLPRRWLQATAQVPDGSQIVLDGKAQVVYEDLPEGVEPPAGVHRAVAGNALQIRSQQSVIGNSTQAVLHIEEAPKKTQPHDKLPMALVVNGGPSTGILRNSLHELGERVLHAITADDGALEISRIPELAALDLARRLPPRLVTAGGLPSPAEHGSMVETVVSALKSLQTSYLAVQGPPGTGKTYLASRVIASLVNDGWRIGITAQSHAVIENVLHGLVKAGCDPDRIAKLARTTNSKTEDGPGVPWRVLSDKAMSEHLTREGIVVGGTAWHFANEKKIPTGHFDLLVIDEAGQFSLANTMATSRAADSLLLLGDPQQLGQVVTGSHPEPVDQSALGWLLQDNAVIPAEYGYFLDKSWRMHPEVCEVVSGLAYDGKLTSAPAAGERDLLGVQPGVRTLLVEHHGNSVSSLEEAAVIAKHVRRLLGASWVDPGAGFGTEGRPLEESDVVVVAAYNAQVMTVRRALAKAGFPGVRVGTVDKFQGQEAPVVFMSMAASDAAQIPRGIDFLIDRNRLNVGISRAQWCTYIVRSPGLSDVMPATVGGLLSLGAFIEVCRETGQHAT